MKVLRLHRPGRRPPSPVSSRTGAPLTVSAPEDAHEREADRWAARVLGGSSTGRRPEPRGLQPPGLTARHDVPGSPGRPLDRTARTFMEARFGHDFSRVRVHADEPAARSAAAVEAAAYTVGHDIVFGAGQYAPETSRGRSLLAHELAHVVQQPPGLSRQPSPAVDKKKAVAHHKQQQRLVVQFLKGALNLTPNPKDPLDPNNLYRNTAQLIESKTRPVSLTVLTPTHYSTDARLAYFDSDVQHPKIDGDYPPDRDPSKPPLGRGLVTEKPEAAGKVEFVPPPVPTTTVTKTEERTVERVSPSTNPPRTPPPAPKPPPPKAPAAAAAPFKLVWTQANMFLFLNDLSRDVTDAELRNTFVHEGQHATDLLVRTRQDPGTTDVDRVLAHYQSEFRAFWIQPVVPRQAPPQPGHGTGVQEIDNPPPPTGRARSQHTETSTCPCPKGQGAAGSTATGTPKSVTSALKNPRQEVIFRHLLKYYPHFRCFYVCDAGFKKAVDDFEFPVGVNVVNSPRLLELNLEMQNLEKTMKPADVAKTRFRQAVLGLDAVDWAFLDDLKLSAAFWKDLDARASTTLVDALKKSAKAGKPHETLDKATLP